MTGTTGDVTAEDDGEGEQSIPCPDATSRSGLVQLVAYRRRVTRREFAEAVDRLERDGEVSERERTVLEDLARNVAEAVLPVPAVDDDVREGTASQYRGVEKLLPDD